MLAPAQSQASVTIGSNLSSSQSLSDICFIPCTAVQLTHPGVQLPSPIDGVVVRWRIKKSAVDWGVVNLRILRPLESGTFDGVGTSASVLPPVQSTGILDFATRLPIRTGDHIGLTTTSQFEGANTPGATRGFWSSTFPDSGPASAPTTIRVEREVFLNADIETDADSDGFGDETQDQCPTNPALTGPCPPARLSHKRPNLHSLLR
jgi:hypothetical protein